MISGIGVDVVHVPRFVAHLRRTPRLAERLFTAAERNRGEESLAARFAAKEALIKALGGTESLRWTEAEVVGDEHGKPAFVLHGRAAELARERGVSALHLSLSHDGETACAFVIAERVAS